MRMINQAVRAIVQKLLHLREHEFQDQGERGGRKEKAFCTILRRVFVQQRARLFAYDLG